MTFAPDAELRSGHRPISERVIDAIAQREGASPGELDPPLYEAVNPDALDDLFRNRTDGTVEFPYLGYRVVIGTDSQVDLYRRDD